MDKEHKMNRDEMRASIFSSEYTSLKRASFKLNGVDLEVQQPTLKEMNKISEHDEKKTGVPAVVQLLLDYVYIPNTQKKMFDPSDAEQLANMPLGQWLTNFNDAFSSITSFDVEESEKN